jgi:hypothetical protein
MPRIASLVNGALLLAFGAALASPVYAAGPFATLDGAWRGGGSVTLLGGQTERLACKAYYNTKDGGAGLGLAISCASPSNKFELWANLKSNGSNVTGSWEERAFNSTGDVTGKASDSAINLSISGTLQATMSIRFASGSQSVSISTDGTGFKSVNLTLSRI